MKTFVFFTGVFMLLACRPAEKKNEMAAPVYAASQTPLPDAPQPILDSIKKQFPTAVPVHSMTDSILHFMSSKYGITADKMLMGVSTCVDDIIYTKNFHLHPEIKGPFHLGGLAGLPFTGISGLEAFAHHIPDDGVMLLLVEPHIGYSYERGWGYVLRHEQHLASSCCGALMGTLAKLQQGKLSNVITEDDYQGGKIAELALRHEKEILASGNPIIELTKVTLRSAEKGIRADVPGVEMAHVKYVVIITGIIINTDFTFSDYEFIDHLMIYDPQKKVFIEELRSPEPGK